MRHHTLFALAALGSLLTIASTAVAAPVVADRVVLKLGADPVLAEAALARVADDVGTPMTLVRPALLGWWVVQTEVGRASGPGALAELGGQLEVHPDVGGVAIVGGTGHGDISALGCRVRLAVLPLALLLSCGPTQTGEADVIPRPASVTLEPGFFELGSGARIAVSAGAEGVGELLAGVLRPSTGFDLPVQTEDAGKGDIGLVLEDVGQGPEGYVLEVTARSAVVRAESTAGLFYGGQTLRQLMPPQVESGTPADVAWEVPRGRIEDRPRFAWRGTMLDVARHFFGPDEVKRLVDLAAYHKLNRLHLHLTDDQGWRIDIESWPDLALVGGSSGVGGGPGGYYSQEQYADIVEYAAARFVTVVPEIDMPGHVGAALASYPQLNESGEAIDLYTGTDVGWSALWLEGAATQGFVEDVIGEMADMTPGPWLHVGSDEAFATDAGDYAWFMTWVKGLVEGAGKTTVGWEELGNVPLDGDFVAQAWRLEEGADAAVAQGASVILSPAEHAYLDMMYDGESPVGTFWAGLTDVRDAYEWDPTGGFPEESVVGVEAPLWTETVETREHLDFLTWPRLAGHAELAWSVDAQTWDEYRSRLAVHGRRLDVLQVGYWRSPLVDWTP